MFLQRRARLTDEGGIEAYRLEAFSTPFILQVYSNTTMTQLYELVAIHLRPYLIIHQQQQQVRLCVLLICYLCMYVCMYVCTYVCIYIIYVCVYVCMYVCMYVWCILAGL